MASASVQRSPEVQDTFTALTRVIRQPGEPSAADIATALSATLIVPLDESIATPSGTLRLRTLTDPDGRGWIPAFGDDRTFRLWIQRRVKYVELDALRVFETAARDRGGVVLNAGSADVLFIGRRQVVLLAEGRAPTAGSLDTGDAPRYIVSRTSDQPEIVQMVAAAARMQTDLERAYVLRGSIGRGPEHTIIGLYFRPEAAAETHAATTEELSERLRVALGRDFADLVDLSEDGDVQLARHTRPAYQRAEER